MNPTVLVGLFVVAIIVILILRAKGETRVGGDFGQPTMPPQPSMPTIYGADDDDGPRNLDKAKRDQLINAIRSGNKAEAVRLYVEASGASLETATATVEKLSKFLGVLGNIIPDQDASATVEPDWDAIEEQLLAGNKIEAIKLYREQTGCDLKEAKEAVEAYEAENRENF